MASNDRRVIVERIDYTQLFGFTRIFRSFIMAIEGSRLLLSLVIVLLLALWGLVLDSVFNVLPGDQGVMPGEFTRYAQSESRWKFSRDDEQIRQDTREALLERWPELKHQFDHPERYLPIPEAGPRTETETIDEYNIRLHEQSKIGANRQRQHREFLAHEKDKAKNASIASLYHMIDEKYKQLYSKEKKALKDQWAEKKEAAKTKDKAQGDRSREHFKKAVEDEKKELQQLGRSFLTTMKKIDNERPEGVFTVAVENTLSIFSGLMDASARAVLGLDPQAFGIHHAKPGAVVLEPVATEDNRVRSRTVIGSLRLLAVTMPSWLFYHHRSYFLLFFTVAILIWAFLGGAISRSSAMEATRGEKAELSEAFAYVKKRWFSYLMAPMAPLIVMCIFALIMMFGGVLYNLPGLNLVGALLFWIPLILGFIMAIIFILWIPGVHLFYPALSINGGDFFEAIFTSWSFLITRPWRAIVYFVSALVYGAATYILVGLIVFMTIYFAQRFTGAFVFPQTQITETPIFDAMYSPPVSDNLQPANNQSRLELAEQPTYAFSSIIIKLFVYVFISLLAAYVISYYFAAMTQVFLLLRQRCDGIDYTVIHRESKSNRLFPRRVDSPDRILEVHELKRSDEQKSQAPENSESASENQKTTDPSTAVDTSSVDSSKHPSDESDSSVDESDKKE